MKINNPISQVIFLVMAVFLVTGFALADQPIVVNEPADGVNMQYIKEPSLSDILPMTTDLSVRLTDLENQVSKLLDISLLEKSYAEIQKNLQYPSTHWEKIKTSKDYKYANVYQLKELIEKQNRSFEETSLSLNNAIQQLDDFRKAWLLEKKRWREWRSLMLKERDLEPLRLSFDHSDNSIDKALNLVLFKLNALLTVQKQTGQIRAQIKLLDYELASWMEGMQRSSLLERSPPMLSSHYIKQLRSELGRALDNGFYKINKLEIDLLVSDSWIVLVQILISGLATLVFYRNRKTLSESNRWRFLATRPVSAGFFIGFTITLVVYYYIGAVTWILFITILGAIAFIRLSTELLEAPWKKHFVYAVATALILTRVLLRIDLPLPLFHLNTVFMALAGLVLCLRWARESVRLKEPGIYFRLLQLTAFFLAILIALELGGKENLADFLFFSLLRLIGFTFVFILFRYLVQGGLEWLFLNSPLKRVTVLQSDIRETIGRMGFFIDVALWSLVLIPAILFIFGVFSSLEDAASGFMNWGIDIGAKRLSIGLMLIIAGIIYGSYFISWILQKLVMDEVLVRRHLERGVRLSIGRLIHYAITFTGYFFVLVLLGFELTQLTIMLSALGVGIGFGLQGLVNNFVSGLILLFEQPIREDDIIELNGNWMEIKKIGLRATIAETYDESDVIIPNADLLSNQVINWTLMNRQVRLIIPVSVAYGSDIPLVIETLIASANTHTKVLKSRKPQVLFLSFGESSLDFELRVWVSADERLQIKSDLHEEINRRFEEAKIEIPFPQRDLHLHGFDETLKIVPS